MPTVLTIDDARALITTALTDDELEDVIEREEAWLARRIGPLIGARLESFTITSGSETLYLGRPTTSATATDGTASPEVRVIGWSDVIRVTGSWQGPEVVIESTPDDELEVRRALVTLVRTTIAETPYAGETAGAHSASVDDQQVRAMRWTAWKGLLRPDRPRSLKVASSVLPPATLHPFAVTVAGS